MQQKCLCLKEDSITAMLSPTGKHLPSINKYRKDIGLDIKGISVGHHNIRIFTRFQGPTR